MKIRYILLLIITVLGVSSCYDDKGNYSYDPKNDIKITFDASYFEAILGEKIKLTPRLNGRSLEKKFPINEIWNGLLIP